jgi:hypothetical protein
LSFSFIILQGLRKIGVAVNFQEAQAFLHHWAVVGNMLGLADKLLVFHEKEAAILCKRIEERHFKPSEAGVTLTKYLLDSFKHTPPFNVLKGFAATYIRYVVGEKVGDILAIPPADWTSNFIPLLKLRNNYRSLNPFSATEIQKNVTNFTNIVLKMSENTRYDLTKEES